MTISNAHNIEDIENNVSSIQIENIEASNDITTYERNTIDTTEDNNINDDQTGNIEVEDPQVSNISHHNTTESISRTISRIIVGDEIIDRTIIEDETQGTSNITIPSPEESQMTTPRIDEDENERTEDINENTSITNINILQETDTNILANTIDATEDNNINDDQTGNIEVEDPQVSNISHHNTTESISRTISRIIVGDEIIDRTIIEDETQGTSNITIPSPEESQMTTPRIDEDENESTEEEDDNNSLTNIIILKETDADILATYSNRDSIKNKRRNKKNKNRRKKRKRDDTDIRHEITRNNNSTLLSPTESQETTDNVEDNENGSNNNQTGKRTRKKKRQCTENNESFFCSCNRLVERRPRGLIIHEERMKDVQRKMVDNGEIDIYVIMLNNQYGPTKYVMQTSFFYGFLRSLRETGSSNISEDMAITLQRTAPMDGDFTDVIETEVQKIIYNYPTKERFRQIEQVRQYTTYNNPYSITSKTDNINANEQIL